MPPELATDAQAQTVWQARCAPYGRASVLPHGKGLMLQMRLPGQFEDEETGLHYNGNRYYDPTRGRYLTADPLGLRGGLNGYAYVAANPLRFVDPSGLILFAFDGTGNNDPPESGSTLSNVVNFRNLYQDGDPYYISGPGTTDRATGISGGRPDVFFATTGKARIAAMVKNLQTAANSADDSTSLDIDVVGFSRGAAEARDFANQIAANTTDGGYKYLDDGGNAHYQKLNFRFMGLWDTVLSTHTDTYQLGIPNSFQYVAHAVALNEHRGTAIAFPLESIMGLAVPTGDTRIERGFLGSHSDIGGSFADNESSKVALVWMVDQAKAAGVKMDALDTPSTTITSNPVMHDKSGNLVRTPPPGAAASWG